MNKQAGKSSPLILAVETSGRIGSVAVGVGSEILAKLTFSAPIRHSAELFPAITQLLTQISRSAAQVEHIYISVGPGSFTGIRIAVAMAKAIHLANGAKIVPVDSLDAIAHNVTDYVADNTDKGLSITKIATILDAKRGQFFIALYKRHSSKTRHAIRNTKYEKILPGCLMHPSEFVTRFGRDGEPIWLLGEGLKYYAEKFKSKNVHILPNRYWPASAEKIYQLGWKTASAGQFADPVNLVPAYLRRPPAEEKVT